MIITSDILKTIAPAGKKTGFKLFPELAKWMDYYFPLFQIDTKKEYCHFLAQAAHETDSFNTLTEYASGKVYEGRRDLGNINPGDGVKYKGRGIFQITGLNNYHRMDVVLNEPNISFELHPELLATPQYAVWSACVYWDDKGFDAFAHMPDERKIWSKKLEKYLSPFEQISWRINGGFNGIEERKMFYTRCQKINFL